VLKNIANIMIKLGFKRRNFARNPFWNAVYALRVSWKVNAWECALILPKLLKLAILELVRKAP